MPDGEQADLSADRLCPPDAQLHEPAPGRPGDAAAVRLERDADRGRRLAEYGGLSFQCLDFVDKEIHE